MSYNFFLKIISHYLLLIFLLIISLIGCKSNKKNLSFSINTDTLKLEYSKKIDFFDIDEKRTNGQLYSIPSSEYMIEISDLKVGKSLGVIKIQDTVYDQTPMEGVTGI